MHFEQPAPAFMPSDSDLAGFGSHVLWRCLAYLMPMPTMSYADALYA